MKYIINGILQFNSIDGTLYLKDDSQDMVTLSRVACELLILFVTNNATPLSRELILNELWLKRGLSASGNNLNNYVSILRKALAHCGCSDVIKTIPKYGFVFEADVLSDEAESGTVIPVKGCSESNPVHAEEHEPVNSASVISGNNNFIVVLLAMLFVMGACLLIYKNIHPYAHRTKLTKIDDCHIYLLTDSLKSTGRSDIKTSVEAMIKRYNLSCEHGATLYYSSFARRDVGGGLTTSNLLAYCDPERQIPCTNYETYRRQNEDL